MHNRNQPIICKPRYVVHDSYVRRNIPVIHPVVHVNRQNIVNVPRHIAQPSFRNVVVDPGYPGRELCCKPKPRGWF